MAVKKKRRGEKQESMNVPAVMPEMKAEPAPKKKEGLWMSVGWVMLLAGGLAHMLPEQMAPLLRWSALGLSLQMAVGAVSVVLALYFLLGE